MDDEVVPRPRLRCPGCYRQLARGTIAVIDVRQRHKTRFVCRCGVTSWWDSTARDLRDFRLIEWSAAD